MRLSELNNIIMESNSNEWIYDDALGLYVFENNIDITITRERREEFEHFYESWANSFPDRNAYRADFFIRYRGNVVSTVHGVDVDGLRVFIPLPRLSDMSISNFQYSFGEIVNNCVGPSREYDNYLNRAGISVR